MSDIITFIQKGHVMALKIGVVNQKGGVGKTTTAICLTDALTQIGYKTLLIDFDPQANTTSVFIDEEPEKTVYDCIIKKEPIKNVIVKGNAMGDLIPSSNGLAVAAKELVIGKAGEVKLKNAISEIEDDYEVIVVDSGPTAGIMMDNVLAAVDGVIIPMEPEKFAIDGLTSLIQNINEAREDLNPDLAIYGLLLTKYNKSKSTHKKTYEQFKNLDDSIIHRFETIIRDTGAIPSVHGFKSIDEPQTKAEERIVSAQGSIFKYGSSNNGSKDYLAFAKELLEVIGNG